MKMLRWGATGALTVAVIAGGAFVAFAATTAANLYAVGGAYYDDGDLYIGNGYGQTCHAHLHLSNVSGYHIATTTEVDSPCSQVTVRVKYYTSSGGPYWSGTVTSASYAEKSSKTYTDSPQSYHTASV